MAYWVDQTERFRPAYARAAPRLSLISPGQPWTISVHPTRKFRLVRSANFPRHARDFLRYGCQCREAIHHAFECDFISRICYEANKSGDIFNVRLLEKSDATRDFVGYAAPGKLQLKLDRMIMRPVEHSDVVQ